MIEIRQDYQLFQEFISSRGDTIAKLDAENTEIEKDLLTVRQSLWATKDFLRLVENHYQYMVRRQERLKAKYALHELEFRAELKRKLDEQKEQEQKSKKEAESRFLRGKLKRKRKTRNKPQGVVGG